MPTTVMHVINSLNRGGAERTLASLVTNAASADTHEQAKHVIVTLIAGGPFEQEVRSAGIEVHSLRMRRGIPSPRALIRLVALLRRFRPDTVISWLYHADLLATIAVVLAGRPRLIWNLRGTRKDARQTSRTTIAVVRVLAVLSRIPWAVGANSYAGRRDHEAAGYHPKRWAYLPNGFDTTRWRADEGDRRRVRQELGFDDDHVALVMVGRAEPQKDHQTLLDAAELLFRTHPNARLVLIGRMTAELPLGPASRSRVIALEERGDVPRLLRGCDIGVLSSAFGEGLPNVVAEKMLTELPCVVTDVGDAARLVGDSGIVVPPREPARMADALRRLIDVGDNERTALGQRARQRVASQYSIDAMMAAYARLWQH